MTEGIEHHVASRLEEATARYAQVIKMQPDHGEAWRLLGVIAMQRGDSTARNLLERAILIDARDAAAHSALGALNEMEGKLDRAYAAYVTARGIDPRHAAASVGLTRVALKLGRTEEAIAVGEATLAGGTVNPSLYRALGGARLLVRDYRGAADAFEAALRIRPQADSYAYLGGAYAHLNLADAAIIACERALAMDPVHVVATFHLGTWAQRHIWRNRAPLECLAIVEHASVKGSFYGGRMCAFRPGILAKMLSPETTVRSY